MYAAFHITLATTIDGNHDATMPSEGERGDWAGDEPTQPHHVSTQRRLDHERAKGNDAIDDHPPTNERHGSATPTRTQHSCCQQGKTARREREPAALGEQHDERADRNHGRQRRDHEQPPRRCPSEPGSDQDHDQRHGSQWRRQPTQGCAARHQPRAPTLQHQQRQRTEHHGRQERQPTAPEVGAAPECEQHHANDRIREPRRRAVPSFDHQDEAPRRHEDRDHRHWHDTEQASDHRRHHTEARQRVTTEPQVVPQVHAATRQLGPEVTAGEVLRRRV